MHLTPIFQGFLMQHFIVFLPDSQPLGILMVILYFV